MSKWDDPYKALRDKQGKAIVTSRVVGETMKVIGRFPQIGGIDVEVVSEEESESADFVVCVPRGAPTLHTDNVHTFCAFCERPIFHRPHAPKRPPKICVDCAVKLPAEKH